MKTFFFFGRNHNNKSGVSWKIWKIERRGTSLHIFWGPAVIDGRKVSPRGELQSKVVRFRSDAAARADEARRIDEKLGSGYERKPRAR